MNKVIAIHLNGKSYQLEEKGYEALREYLDKAAAKLSDNPDKDELMNDFEQAIAEKCDRYISHHKNVVTAAEIEEILKKIGPVDGADDTTKTEETVSGAGTHNATPDPKRLYRIIDGQWIAGVCTGIGAYFNVSVQLIRILFVIVTFAAHGWGILIYCLLWIFLPTATTNDEVAAAHGAPPFTAQDFINKAKLEYEKFGTHYDKREFKKNMRDMKRKWRDDFKVYRHGAHYRQSTGRLARVMSGVLGLLLLAATVTWITAVAEFLQRGVVFGHAFGSGQPIWMSLVFITSAFGVVAVVLKSLKREAQQHEWNIPDYYHNDGDGFRAVLFILFAAALIYTSIHLFPSAHDGWQNILHYLNSTK